MSAWTPKVVLACSNVGYRGFSHQVQIGIHTYTVDHSNQRRATKKANIGGGLVRESAVEYWPPYPQPSEQCLLIAAAPALHDCAAFLCERLRELENGMSCDEDASQFDAHVAPALARMEAVLASAIEARQGEDAQRLHAKHESAVPKGDAHD